MPNGGNPLDLYADAGTAPGTRPSVLDPNDSRDTKNARVSSRAHHTEPAAGLSRNSTARPDWSLIHWPFALPIPPGVHMSRGVSLPLAVSLLLLTTLPI